MGERSVVKTIWEGNRGKCGREKHRDNFAQKWTVPNYNTGSKNFNEWPHHLLVTPRGGEQIRPTLTLLI